MIMKTFLGLFLFLYVTSVYSQFKYEASASHPFGKINPEAPKELKDFDLLIGECNCISRTRKANGNWNEPVNMIWRFKYIMNGMAVQDETLKEDGTYSGSIRQYSKDSLRWYVHYYSSAVASPVLSTWEGNKKENKNIVLYREQKAPNGMDGFYRLTFSDISKSGYQWIGEWVDTKEQIVFPTWKISCTKK